MTKKPGDRYGLTEQYGYPEEEPPAINYLPSIVTYPARIGIIGCGAETFQYLTAYLRAGYDVVAFYDPDIKKAEKVRDSFYPLAKVYDDHRSIVDDATINFVDAASVGPAGFAAIKDCLKAGKHVLASKHTIESLDEGLELASLAREHNVNIAVNHDARWAPGWRYALELVQEGYIGNVVSFEAHAMWNHNWLKGSALDEDELNVLRYFAYYWFDMINIVMGNARALSVSSIIAKTTTQAPKSPLLSTTQVQYPNAVASITLNGDCVIFGMDATVIAGDEGMIMTYGPDRHEQELWFISRNKVYYPKLHGDWLPGGFHGAMAELIKSVEEGREPENSAVSSLESTAICYAALTSVREKRQIAPWDDCARRG